MPELPEVETYVRELEPDLRDQIIQGATVRWRRTIDAPAIPQFLTSIQGYQFNSFDRRGKYMLFGLTDVSQTGGHDRFHGEVMHDEATDKNGAQKRLEKQTLIVHLRMTGHLLYYPRPVAPDKHTHVVFDLVGGRQLHYQDSRKFGRIWLVADPQTVLIKLGPEPLDGGFQPDEFYAKLRGRSATIKAMLLDQQIVAGVGNIYADESLHLAQIHPARPAQALTLPEVTALHEAIQTVLQKAIAGHGSSLGISGIQNYQRPSGEAGSFQEEHRVFQRTGQPCTTCGAQIERIVITQRSTHFCPHCQPQTTT